MRYCSGCGSPLQGKERFCAVCGSAVEQRTAQQNIPVQQPRSAPATSVPKKSKASVIFCIIGVVALLAAVTIVLLPKMLSDERVVVEEEIAEEVEAEPVEQQALWEFEEATGVLTIYGGEYTENYDAVYNAAPWSVYKDVVTSVVVEEGVERIGSGAFEGMRNLVHVTLPQSLETLGDRCFANCTILYMISIPAGVTWIGDAVFRGCAAMVEIQVASGNTAYCSVAGALYNKDCSIFIQLPASNGQTEYVIPNTVREICAGAFYGCRRLESVSISSNVREIRELTFYGCSSMTKIVLPMSVRVIHPSAFTQKMNRASDGTPVIACTALKKIVYDGLQEWFYSINIGDDNDNLFRGALHYVDPWNMPQSTIDYFETYLR